MTRGWHGWALGWVAFCFSLPAAGQELRFQAHLRGDVLVTGNSLGLSKASDNGPGTNGSIGTFMTLDPSSADTLPAPLGTSWPLGTTANWQENGSAAVLDLPPGATVAYAELVWGGSYRFVEDVSASLDNAVWLGAGADRAAVPPAGITAVTLSEYVNGFSANYYIRSAEVTAFVQEHGASTYAVEAVPATQAEANNSLNAAGWALVVAYALPSEPLRQLAVMVGGSAVHESAATDYSLNGFCTPEAGPVVARVAVAALEGDAATEGDSFLVAASAAGPFSQLAGPNNPAANFFGSQLNSSTGLDVRGTFGDRNHDVASSVNQSGARQGWDVTTLAVSALSNAQQEIVYRASTVNDVFVPVAMASSIPVGAPDLWTSSAATPEGIALGPGDELTISLEAHNAGTVSAELALLLPWDERLALVSYSTNGVPGDAAGSPVQAEDLALGVAGGVLEAGASIEVTLVARVLSSSSEGASLSLVPIWSAQFTNCAGDYEEFVEQPLVSLELAAEPGSGGMGGADASGGSGSGGDSTVVVPGVGGSSGVGGSPRPTGGASDSDGGNEPSPQAGGAGGEQNLAGAGPTGEGPGGGAPDAQGGCGCSYPRTSPQGLGFVALLALLTSLRRRRYGEKLTE